MKGATTLLGAMLVAAFPLLLPLALYNFGLSGAAAGFALLALLRLLTLRAVGSALPVALAALLLALALGAWASGSEHWFRFYPVLVNALLLGLFAASLWRGPPVAERLARLQEAELPPEAVAYTRRVTQVWCAFFAVNGAIALWTAQAASLQTWSLYNGLIAYLLMGGLFAGEWLLRQRVRRRPHA
ncbi:hypothetical protein [Parahaliea aestuarii]|nr:hypothetical protein [Parahaliea aestuarii]